MSSKVLEARKTFERLPELIQELIKFGGKAVIGRKQKRNEIFVYLFY